MGCVASVPAFDDDGGERVAAGAPPPNLPPPSRPPAVRAVTEGELYSATAGFSALRLLGEGGFGRVYRGVWADGTSVAVKVLDSDASGRAASLQGPPEFWTEVAVLSAAAGHPHIVPLLGVCSEPGGVLASVLAHAAGGSLRSALASDEEEGGVQARPPLAWGGRLAAATGAAAGLATLHALGWAHGDVSSGNVLLNADGGAWLSDFGLARRVRADGEPAAGPAACPAASPRQGTPTPPRGAWPYLAPELLAAGGPASADGRPTPSADVWALGVVLLELVTGRQAGGGGPTPLVDRVRPALAGGALIATHLDPHLFSAEGEGPPAPQAAALAEAAAGCLAPDPAARPTAAAVAGYLGKAAASGGGGRVRRAVEPRPPSPTPPPPPPVHPVPSLSLMDEVTALDDAPSSGNPFL